MISSKNITIGFFAALTILFLIVFWKYILIGFVVGAVCTVIITRLMGRKKVS